MEYCILSDADPTVLAGAVNQAIVGGWTPQGGLTVCYIGNDDDVGHVYEYSQALTRKRPFMTDGAVEYTFPVQKLEEGQEEINATPTR